MALKPVSMIEYGNILRREGNGDVKHAENPDHPTRDHMIFKPPIFLCVGPIIGLCHTVASFLKSHSILEVENNLPVLPAWLVLTSWPI
jgi:hypothetical protein